MKSDSGLLISDCGLRTSRAAARQMFSNPQSAIRNSKSRAFTLPEVLAALVFVGIVLPVVMRGVTVSMQAGRAARHRVEAAQLAKQKIDEFLVVRDPTGFISATGDFGTGWEEYRWTSKAQLGDDGVYDVTVSVDWVEQATEKSFSLSTMIYPSTVTSTETTTTDPAGGGT